MSTYQLAGGNRIAASLVARNPVPDVGPIPSAIELDCALPGYRAAGGTAPLIECVVAGRIGRHECCIAILAAIVVGAGIPFGTIGFGIAALVGPDRADID